MNELTEQTYRRLKREVDDCKTAAERAQGALDQLMAQLKNEFDCDTLKQAKERLSELETKRDRVEEKFGKALKDYERKWKEV